MTVEDGQESHDNPSHRASSLWCCSGLEPRVLVDSKTSSAISGQPTEQQFYSL